ncbi:hypothetical protein FRZ61_49940 [Hypericibacter adhaerens]|uniref:Uncharacterized protein n=1 Tax=Hypericibacter adhaerens TaxID=2602016 RepID=A0A5J6N590_9PROT|nr:hypothetical protein FRZ61_49940 [Hypericibacter adhaerens]
MPEAVWTWTSTPSTSMPWKATLAIRPPGLGVPNAAARARLLPAGKAVTEPSMAISPAAFVYIL